MLHNYKSEDGRKILELNKRANAHSKMLIVIEKKQCTHPVVLVVVSIKQDGLQLGSLVGLERLHSALGLLELVVAHDYPGELQVLGQGLLQAGHGQPGKLGPLCNVKKISVN